MKTITRIGAALTCAAFVGGCSSSSDSASNGTVSISLMDRPVDDLTELWVTISEMWIKPAGAGPAFQLALTSTPLTVNLLELDDLNASVLVDEAVVAAGSYNWLEMQILDGDTTESWAITTSGGMEEIDVDVPSGRIRLVSGFDVGENQAVRLLFDWDVRSGLTDAVGRGGYLLRPAFRMLDVDEYGAVSGTIPSATLTAEATCSGAGEGDIVVYVYDGDVTPDEIGGNPSPITTVDATPSASVSGDFEYRIVLMPEDYSLAFTCEGLTDSDADGDNITLLPPVAGNPVNVTTAGLTGFDF
ncbi:MAG: DUF4382 domain-containing protein [Gammaproteobacteria bacterium]|nr:DUF4382 domain-containing protein [Gammaproteobacteria bacterium]